MASPRRVGPTPSDTTAPAKTVRLVDEPADGDGRRYVIERELTVMAELDAIVADYLEQAATWDVIPAAGSCPSWPNARRRSDDTIPTARAESS